MVRSTRREFLGDIGRGMLLAGLGTTLAADLGIGRVGAAEAESRLTFGALEPLVSLMQETEPAKLTALLVEKLNSGTELRTLVAAGALANARTFGGQDYIGFHTFMALAPAWRMSQQLPTALQPLPVLKVLYRNANRIQEFGGVGAEILHPVTADPIPAGAGGEYVREMTRTGDIEKADRAFANFANLPVGEAFHHLQFAVEDEVDVHRVVLSWRAWDTLDLAGEQWAHTLLRQSIRYCANIEHNMLDRKYPTCPIRTVLPNLLDQYKLLGRTLGQKQGDDGWLQQLASTIMHGTREEAAGAVAQAIAEGFAPESIGESLSLAANMLVLHDPGRTTEQSNPDKPAGSCHGDSVGVHASDAANAWRNIVRVSDQRNTVCSLIVGAFHTGGQTVRSNKESFPTVEQLAEIETKDPTELLRETETAIRASDQYRAAATVHRYGQLGHQPRAVQELLLRYATSEDGALHAEKYFNTAVDEFAIMRPAFRWGQLTALARVTASEYGHRSAGYEEAKKLLNV